SDERTDDTSPLLPCLSVRERLLPGIRSEPDRTLHGAHESREALVQPLETGLLTLELLELVRRRRALVARFPGLARRDEALDRSGLDRVVAPRGDLERLRRVLRLAQAGEDLEDHRRGLLCLGASLHVGG